MRTVIAASSFLLLLALAPTGAVTAQGGGAATAPAGDAARGKAVWALGNTSCRNCHGGDGEGAFAPTLAGRKIPYARFLAYVRNPLARMPAYVPSQLTDQEVADMVAYFDSLPSATPDAWRTPLPTGAPRGQQLAVSTIGCGQCHGATLETPRHGAAEVNGDFEWFKKMVYEHTDAQSEQFTMLDPSGPRTTPGPAGPTGRWRMGNYSRARLPETMLKEIWDWVVDLGPLVPLSGQMSPGQTVANGVTYTVNLANAGVKGKGLTAEDVTVALAVPPGASVVSATGTGYEGVRADAETRGNVAIWRVPRLAATEQQTFTITLSGTVGGPGPRATVRWARPAVKADDEVTFGPPGARGRG